MENRVVVVPDNQNMAMTVLSIGNKRDAVMIKITCIVNISKSVS
jgi:hypothetical protein